MAAKKTTASQTYTITGRIRADVMVEVQATSWETALEQAKALKFEDFVTVSGDVSEAESPEIRTIWING
jgi:hypothetical protein